MKLFMRLVLMIGVAVSLTCSTQYTAGGAYHYQYKIEPYSVLAGKVVSVNENRPVTARVSFPGTLIHPVDCSPSGIFCATVPPGTYLVKLEADGYETETMPVVLAAGQSLARDFSLRPVWQPDVDYTCVDEEHPWNIVYFDPGSAVIGDEYLQRLDRAAAMILDHDPVMVEIRGFTDSVGDVFSNQLLSQQRADAVRTYLIQCGVDSRRLVSIGCGENDSGFDNLTHLGKILNRRAELVPLVSH